MRLTIKQWVMTPRGNQFEVDLPAVRVVCPRCDGAGKHDPAGFSNGFTSSEWAEMCAGDEDFASNYFGGRYDVRCEECDGANVVLEVDWSALTPKMADRLERQQRQEARDRAEAAAERRMGA